VVDLVNWYSADQMSPVSKTSIDGWGIGTRAADTLDPSKSTDVNLNSLINQSHNNDPNVLQIELRSTKAGITCRYALYLLRSLLHAQVLLLLHGHLQASRAPRQRRSFVP
jgi:hypothetical protein